MKTEELNPTKDFNNWKPEILSELQKGSYTTQVGEQLLFENGALKLWTIKLLPNESLPFHKHTNNYNWTAMTAGSAISHYETGRIVQIDYKKGDLSYYDHDAKGDFVHNLKNTGNELLEFITIEYKK
jgi:hypothetical protein